MIRRLAARITITVVGGAALTGGILGLEQILGNDEPRGIAQPVALASVAAGPLRLAGPAGCVVTFTVPGKQWGGVWRWSPAILKPAKIERVCVSYPPVGTLATVTLINP